MHLKHGSDTDLMGFVPGMVVHPNDFAGGPDEHFTFAGDFGRKSHREIEFGARNEIVVDGKIYAVSRDIAGVAGFGDLSFFNGGMNNYRER